MRSIFLSVLAVVAALAASSVHAHWDGDDNATGHRYKNISGSFTTYYGSADEALEANLAASVPGSIFCGEKEWNATFGYFHRPYDFAAPFDCGVGSVESNGPGARVYEYHCTVGNEQAAPGTSCTASTICEADGSVSYVAVDNPLYFNHDDCLYRRTSTSANGSYFNVVYVRAGWEEMDEDSIGNSFSGDFSNIGPAVPDGDTVGGPPAAAPGEEWPFAPSPDDPSSTPGAAGAVCPVGQQYGWRVASGLNTVGTSVCLNTNCQAIVSSTPTVSMCTPTGGCSVNVTLTGQRCDGTEDQGPLSIGTTPTTDDATAIVEAIDAMSAGVAQTNQELSRIYGRLGNNAVAAAAGDATIVAAIAAQTSALESALEGAGGGGGECTEGSCDGTLPGGVGEAVDGEAVVMGLRDRIAAAPISVAIGNFMDTLSVSDTCPSFTSDPIAILNDQTFTLMAHCDLWEELAPVLSAMMLVIYSLSGIYLILRA